MRKDRDDNMNRNEICQRLIELIKNVFKERGEQAEITEQTDLIEQLNLDSMEVVTIMVKAEIEFDIEISEEDISDTLLSPLANLVDYIEKRIKI